MSDSYNATTVDGDEVRVSKVADATGEKLIAEDGSVYKADLATGLLSKIEDAPEAVIEEEQPVEQTEPPVEEQTVEQTEPPVE